MTKILIFLIAMILVGCTMYPPIKPIIEDTIIIRAPFDKVWAAIIGTVADMSLPIESIEKDSGLVTTKIIVFANGYGAGKIIDSMAARPTFEPKGAGLWSRGRYTLNIFLKPKGQDACEIRITTYIEAFEESWTKRWHTCYSKGIIESRIINSVRSRLQLVSGKWPKQKEEGDVGIAEIQQSLPIE